MSEEFKAKRIDQGLKRGQELEITVNGKAVKAYQGETVATALLAHGISTCGVHHGRPLGVFCNIGVCHSCLMTIDGVSGVKACQTEVKPEMTVLTRRLSKDQL